MWGRVQVGGTPPPSEYDLPEGWRDDVKALLAAELEAGAKLYGMREDGTYYYVTKDGETDIPPPARADE